jgi:hypothetical protein
VKIHQAHATSLVHRNDKLNKRRESEGDRRAEVSTRESVLLFTLSARLRASRSSEYHLMKMDFILTVGMLLSNLWGTSNHAWGCSKEKSVEVLYGAPCTVGLHSRTGANLH